MPLIYCYSIPSLLVLGKLKLIGGKKMSINVTLEERMEKLKAIAKDFIVKTKKDLGQGLHKHNVN